MSESAEHEGGHTNLMRAALQGRTEELKTLLGGGADVNLKDDEGRTSLTFAVSNISDSFGECDAHVILEGRAPTKLSVRHGHNSAYGPQPTSNVLGQALRSQHRQALLHREGFFHVLPSEKPFVYVPLIPS